MQVTGQRVPPEEFDTLLIDGDLLVFSSCAAIEYGNEPSEVNFNEIANNIDSRVMNMKRRLGAKKVILLFSGKLNFRFQVMPEYKADRANAWRPYHLANGIAYAEGKYESIKEDGLEADDWCGILAHPSKVVIATIDKDIPTVPDVWHYRWETQHAGERLFFTDGYGELECKIKSGNKKQIKGTGRRFFYLQLLTGDPTDGIMGCGVQKTKVYKSGKKIGQQYSTREGVGAVAAYELLKDAHTPGKCMAIVVNEYRKRFGQDWASMLLRNGRCLHMIRVKVDNRIRLWHWREELQTLADNEEFMKEMGVPIDGQKAIDMRDTAMQKSWFDIESQEFVEMQG